MASKAITIDNINPNLLKLEYAVRGPLVIRAAAIQKEIEKVSETYCRRQNRLANEIIKLYIYLTHDS